MKVLKSKQTTLLLMLSLFLVLTGCMKEFDASGYIRSCLNANTKAEFEEYAEITGSTVEEVEALYNQAIDAEMAIYRDIMYLTRKKQNSASCSSICTKRSNTKLVKLLRMMTNHTLYLLQLTN